MRTPLAPCDDEADMRWSLEFPAETALTVPREIVPPGAVAVHRYTRVQVSDGLAGQVERVPYGSPIRRHLAPGLARGVSAGPT